MQEAINPTVAAIGETDVNE